LVRMVIVFTLSWQHSSKLTPESHCLLNLIVAVVAFIEATAEADKFMLVADA